MWIIGVLATLVAGFAEAIYTALAHASDSVVK
jgi:hypothetical protein